MGWNREAKVGNVGQERRFELRGGAPCLDFVNTVAWRSTDRPVEYLGSYEALLAWVEQAGLLAQEEAGVLSGWASAHPKEARGTLLRAIALREAVHGVLFSATIGEPHDEGALTVLNRELSEALSRLCVVRASDNDYAWAWDRGGGSGELLPECLLWPVARSAAELLTSPKLGRIKVCAAEGCGWMFLDESRNDSRRWCDSGDCGNRERVRRYLVRKKRASQA